MIERIVDALDGLPVGPTDDPMSVVGPVIDAASCDRLNAIIAQIEAPARILYRGSVPAHSNFVPPTLVAVDDPSHPLLRDELFGPVLAVSRARSYEEAMLAGNRSVSSA